MKKYRNFILLAFICIPVFLFYVRGFTERNEETVPPKVQILLGKLFSGNEKERINAALRLSDYPGGRVVDALIMTVENDMSDMVKRSAIRSLGNMGTEESLKVLLENIGSESISVKIEAMSAAVNYSSSTVNSAILKEADSPNPIVRQKAVSYLGMLKKNNSLVTDAIVDGLSDISEGVRIAACKVVAQKKIKSAVGIIEDILINERSELVRVHALMALASLDEKRVARILKSALEDGSPLVRIHAAKGLAERGSKAGLDEAVRGIKSSDVKVRIVSCEILGLIGGDDSTLFLEQALGDFDRRVQRSAKEALLKIRKREK